MKIEILYFFDLGIAILCLGMAGILVNKNSLIITLMAVEVMLYGLDVYLLTTSAYLDDITGQVLALYIVSIAAAESAIALALIVLYFKNFNTIQIIE